MMWKNCYENLHKLLPSQEGFPCRKINIKEEIDRGEVNANNVLLKIKSPGVE